MLQDMLKRPPVPIVDRYAETMFRTLEQTTRHSLGQHFLQKDFSGMCTAGKLECSNDEVLIQQRIPYFQAVGHARPVHLCENIPSQIGLHVRDHETFDRRKCSSAVPSGGKGVGFTS